MQAHGVYYVKRYRPESLQGLMEEALMIKIAREVFGCGILALLAGCCCAGGGGSVPPMDTGSNRPNVYVAQRNPKIQRVAILPFKGPTELAGRSMSDVFVTSVLKSRRYKLVERSQLDQVLAETELSLSGLTPSGAAAIGKMLGADGVIIGTVDEYGTVAYKGRTRPVVGCSARLIDSSTGSVVWSVDYAASSTDKSMTLPVFSRQVARQMVWSLKRSW